MNKIIINHWAFRLFTPIVFAFFIYVLILLFFDSALQLLQNLISEEYFICLILSFINFEIWRLIIKVVHKKLAGKPSKQISLQLALSVSTGILITFLIIWYYFKFMIGLVSFTSELTIFCSLFGLSSLLYNMVYISQYLLNYQHKDIITQHEKLKKEAINRWQRFQNRINPNLLYQSLESIIGYGYSDIDKADEILIDLTNLYRQILEDQDELITINKEVLLTEKLKVLLTKIYGKNLDIEIDLKNLDESKYIVPGYLILQVQQILNETIINAIQPLCIKILVKADNVLITYPENLKLSNSNIADLNLNYESETLQWYTHKEISKTKFENSIEINIPLINLDKP